MRMRLFRNGSILTMDPARPAAQAVVTAGERVAYVGDTPSAEAFVKRYGPGGAEVVELAGRTLMPGFHDSHMHYIHYVKSRQTVDLRGARSIGELQERLRQGLGRLEPGQWLLGEGWDHERFRDAQRFPTCRDLDEVTGEVPVLILRTCCHVGVLNSRAMERFGLDRETAAGFGVFAERDADGVPNGVIKENLLDDWKAEIPSAGLPALLRGALQAQRDLFSVGLTSIQSDDFKYVPEGQSFALLNEFRELAERGEMKLRMFEQALLTTPEAMEEFFRQGGGRFCGGSAFRVSGVKIIADGSLGGRTAFMRVPYADAPGERGLPIYRDQGELDRLVMTAHRHNMPVVVHAIGDGGAEMVLRAIRRAREEMPWLSPRHGLVHCQVMGEDLLAKMRELKVTAHVQPIFMDGDMHFAPARLGAERLESAYAWGSMEREGIPLAFGTDCPVAKLRPLDGVYCAVTRKSRAGEGPFLPHQALSLERALYAYTAGSAYAAGVEEELGRVRPGMRADLILLDRDLSRCPPEELLEAQVLQTYVDGVCVYEAAFC